MAASSRLGKGFDAIFYDNSLSDSSSSPSKVNISKIEPREAQPRKRFEEAALSALSSSIKEHGVLQPLLVRESGDGFYQIIAGERRYRAAKMAGLKELPVVIISPDNLSAAQIALVENVQRENLNPVEEAFGYYELSSVYGMKQEEIAEKIGKSRSTIANAMRLISLPESVLDMMREGSLSGAHGRTLLGLEDEKKIPEIAKLVIDTDMSVRALEELVRKENQPKREEEEKEKPVVDYIKELEDKTRELIGRRVKISRSSREKSIKLYYEDNEDLDGIIKLLSGGKEVEL